MEIKYLKITLHLVLYYNCYNRTLFTKYSKSTVKVIEYWPLHQSWVPYCKR